MESSHSQSFGKHITIGGRIQVRMADGAERTFTIGRPHEADPPRGIISHECPIGKALLGAREGDTVTYTVLGKTFTATVRRFFRGFNDGCVVPRRRDAYGFY